MKKYIKTKFYYFERVNIIFQKTLTISKQNFCEFSLHYFKFIVGWCVEIKTKLEFLVTVNYDVFDIKLILN